MATSSLSSFLQALYATSKIQDPRQGRRRRKLGCLQAFWDRPPSQRPAVPAPSTYDPDTVFGTVDEEDDDPFDAYIAGPELALLVRTDFSDDEAWNGVLATVKAAERELVGDTPTQGGDGDVPMPDSDGPESAGSSSARSAGLGSAGLAGDADMGDETSDDETSPSNGPPSIFAIVSPAPASPHRARLTHISNLTALRLLAEPSLAPAPARPQGTKRATPPSRLVDQDGCVEVYGGKRVWVYDARSNVDGSVRVVSGRANLYGTATADSWRARAAHICELEVNMSLGAMKVDFGGLDRWDFEERLRDIEEAQLLPSVKME